MQTAFNSWKSIKEKKYDFGCGPNRAAAAALRYERGNETNRQKDRQNINEWVFVFFLLPAVGRTMILLLVSDLERSSCRSVGRPAFPIPAF